MRIQGIRHFPFLLHILFRTIFYCYIRVYWCQIGAEILKLVQSGADQAYNNFNNFANIFNVQRTEFEYEICLQIVKNKGRTNQTRPFYCA